MFTGAIAWLCDPLKLKVAFLTPSSTCIKGLSKAVAILVILAFFKFNVKFFPGLVFSPSPFKAWEIPANLIAVPPDFISV